MPLLTPTASWYAESVHATECWVLSDSAGIGMPFAPGLRSLAASDALHRGRQGAACSRPRAALAFAVLFGQAQGEALWPACRNTWPSWPQVWLLEAKKTSKLAL